ncbi:MAG: hypothetical protein AAB638_04035 [Patescibacteria group bacterium]
MKTLSSIILSILLVISGCNITKRRSYIVLFDNSISIPYYVVQRNIRTIQETILPNIGPKDKLTLQFIDACSQGQAERIYSFDLAEIDFTSKADGANHQADSAKARMKRYIMGKVRDEIATAILTKRMERNSCGSFTDIIHALTEAVKLVENKKSFTNSTDKLLNEANGDENYQYETSIILISDMINENREGTFNFTTFGRISEGQVTQKLSMLKDANKIPDLRDVKIFVHGATASPGAGLLAGKEMDNVKFFWQHYFELTGAELKAYGYDSEKEIKDYQKEGI